MKKNCVTCNIEFDTNSELESVCNDCVAFSKFTDLVRDQFTYGGQKYALNGSETRESTDVLFEKHGKNWLIGTIDKYIFRFKNLSRERDLLKIACYMYIMWLKRGFYVRPDGINDPPLDTNITQKKEHFEKFINKVSNDYVDRCNSIYSTPYKNYFNESRYLSSISKSLGEMSKNNWKDISEYNLVDIFVNSFLTWVKRYANIETHDTDTTEVKR